MSLSDVVKGLYRGACALVASATFSVSGCALSDKSEMMDVLPVEYSLTYEVFGPSQDVVDWCSDYLKRVINGVNLKSNPSNMTSDFVERICAANRFYGLDDVDEEELELRLYNSDISHYLEGGKGYVSGLVSDVGLLQELDNSDGIYDNNIPASSILRLVKRGIPEGGDYVSCASLEFLISFDSDEALFHFHSRLSEVSVNTSNAIMLLFHNAARGVVTDAYVNYFFEYIVENSEDENKFSDSVKFTKLPMRQVEIPKY